MPVTTLWEMLERTVRSSPGAPALIERPRRVSFEELLEESARAAGALAAQGVRRGDVVGVWLPNWVEAVVLEFALARLGAANLGINTRYSVFELAHLLRRGAPVGVMLPGSFHGLDFAGRLRDAVAESGVAPWVATVREGAAVDVGGGSWALDGADAPAPPVAGEPADLVNYFTTSGSTGFPKLAGHDQAAIVTHCRNVRAAMDMRPGDAFLAALPLSGVFGFNPSMAMLGSGGTLVLEPVFDAKAALEDMVEHDVTHLVGGDDLLARLLDEWQEGRPALRAFRRGGVADFAGRAGEVARWANREFGASVTGVYGSSELFSLTSLRPGDVPVDERARGGGRPVSEAIEVRAVDPETGSPCEPGAVGELQFRGYNVLTDYLGDPDAAQGAFTADGWFRSGDLGSVEPDGELTYVCRAGDALRLRGFLVEPAEIEQFLMSHPEVDVAKVVGVRAEDDEDLAVGFVTLRDGAEVGGGELLEYCRARLARFKLPSAINVIPEFPVTTGTNGTKIKTAELRRLAAEQLGRTASGKGSA